MSEYLFEIEDKMIFNERVREHSKHYNRWQLSDSGESKNYFRPLGCSIMCDIEQIEDDKFLIRHVQIDVDRGFFRRAKLKQDIQIIYDLTHNCIDEDPELSIIDEESTITFLEVLGCFYTNLPSVMIGG